MRGRSKKLWLSGCLALGVLGSNWAAALDLPGCYGDHMVLMRERPIVMVGRAAPEGRVTVRLAEEEVTAQADATGKWRVELTARPASGPYVLTVREPATQEERHFDDVWIGEVWLLSGQSNMALALIDCENGEAELARADYPRIRFFQVPETMARVPQETVNGSWQVCAPENARLFSGIGYYFARQLQDELNVPVGIINASRGATGIESWMDAASLRSVTGKDYSAIAAGTEPLVGEPVENVLYNGMIHPWSIYPVRGILWYQGEANAYRNHQEYGLMAPAMLHSWREAWNDPELGFLLVQLAAFRGHEPGKRFSEDELNNPDPGDGGIWGAFRPVQAGLLTLERTGMATAIDLGDPYDIHPRRKREVGERLALEARRVIYGESELVSHGPYPASVTADDGALRIAFDNPGSSLAASDGQALRHFAVAGADGKFFRAQAEITGENEVRVWAEEVPHPRTVRYAWSDYPGGINFYNRHGLPGVPFQLAVK